MYCSVFICTTLRKYAVLHWIIFIGKKHIITFTIYVPVNHITWLIYSLTDNTVQRRNMISWLWLYLTAKRISKNSLQSTFASTLFHRRSQDFWLGGGPKPKITCNDVIRNFRKRNFLWDKDIVEWKIRSRGPVWHETRISLKGEGLNQKLKSENV